MLAKYTIFETFESICLGCFQKKVEEYRTNRIGKFVPVLIRHTDEDEPVDWCDVCTQERHPIYTLQTLMMD